ncbi:2-dehydro-3-deoxygalactonokinase [Sediminibacillus albus]|uniref:2-dehydro-3-deoxygalactonokinase n=1 Tax=Sediminibacillus albus TaxID=407036 RepID=A0A1G8YJC8_9BACI|nr:2-dehydro-3-deoxygalactonokinase [Sediminibacillus albus]SDK02305.1 2-dehydro-3-deoxygalactonokinase [Sediminibacillus albus]
MYTIFIDSGTTNSRIRLLNEQEMEIQKTVKISVGVKNTAIEGNNHKLKAKLAEGVEQVLNLQGVEPSQVKYIAASGMITSGLGLHEVPHVQAPVQIADFVSHAEVVKTADFLSIPVVYIPGMKNDVTEENCADETTVDSYDVMRGEEVETFGLLNQLEQTGRGLMVLPGSHTKYVDVEEGTLRSCTSTLGGELIQAANQQTILSSSLSDQLIEQVDPAKLQAGYRAAEKNGLTRSLYHIRLFDLFSEWSRNERANYFVGAVLHEDLEALRRITKLGAEPDWVIVGGSNPLRQAFVQMLKTIFPDWKVYEATDKQVDKAPVLGAWEIGSLLFPTDR